MASLTRSAFSALLGLGLLGASARPISIETYRDTGCGCCEGWVRAAREHGYRVTMHDLDRTERLRRFGMTEATAGCHTSLVGGYHIEGHVPFDILARFLGEKPHVRGIAIPGMPSGVAGMDGPRMGPIDIVTIEAHPRLYARI